MPKKCKDCDPNKFIEGLAWRGKNGWSYDGYTLYNDVGKPSSTDITLADVSDLVDAYNPAFSQNSSNPSPLPESLFNPILIEGIDRGQGFWFVWSLINGLVMYGNPGVALTSASITSSSVASTKIGDSFNFSVTLNKVATSLSYNNFGDIADANSTDPLRFPNNNSNTIPLIKDKINRVGRFTGIISSILNGNRYIKSGKTTVLETFTDKQSLTITSKDINGNDPIYVTSAPTKHAFINQGFSYTLTTNIAASSFNASLDSSSLNFLSNLGLVWNENSKTITGNVSSNIGNEIKNFTLNFTITGPNADAGNRANFNLVILYGQYNASIALPTISNKNFSGTVGAKFSNTLAGLNNKHSIIGISSLPEGLVFNSSSKTITGSPKHAGTFYAFASCSNARGSSSTANLQFDFAAYTLGKTTKDKTFASKIQLPVYDYNVLKNNKFTLNFFTNSDDIIQFKKINKNEFEEIRKNGKPEKITNVGLVIPPTSFSPGKGIEAESCFWIQVEDPSTSSSKIKEFDIKIQGNYAITYSSDGLQDLVGNVCYTPDSNSSGPASTPFVESLNVTCTNTIKPGLSANPAENVPTVTISPTQIEHQVVFLPDGALDTSSSFATQRLSQSNRLKYPNGIPAQNGISYRFYVQFADICSFNNTYQNFLIYFGTYSPMAGDVYSCWFDRW